MFPSCKFKGNFASCVINTSVPRSLDGGQLSTLGYYLWESPQAQEGRGLVMMMKMKMIIFNKNGDDVDPVVCLSVCDGASVPLRCHLKPNIVLPKVAQIAHVAHVAQVKDCNTDDDSPSYHLKTNILLAE